MDLRSKLHVVCLPVGALVFTLALALSAAAGCASEQKRTALPPPVYEQPELPPWQAPPMESSEGASEGEGEWVDGPPPGMPEKPGSGAPSGAAGAPPQGD